MNTGPIPIPIRMRTSLWCVVLPALLFLLGGCSEKTDRWRGRIEVVNGVRTITSDAPMLHAPDSLAQIILTKDLVIEGDVPDSVRAFPNAYGVTTDGRGNIYIADAKDTRILKYDADGAFLDAIGSKGIAPTQFREPVDMAVDASNNLYVVDYQLHRVTKFGPDLKFADLFDTRLIHPRHIRVDAEGNILVFIVTQHDLIYKYSPKGDLLSTFYNPKEDMRIMGTLDQLIAYSDAGMEVSNDGYVYVSSRHPYRIRKFDRVNGLALEFSRTTPFEFKPFDSKPAEVPPPVGTSGSIAVLPDGRVLNVIQHQTFSKVESDKPGGRRAFRIESMDRWMDVFTTDGKWQMSSRITVPGFPVHVDRKGRIYFIELKPPRVVRYKLSFPDIP